MITQNLLVYVPPNGPSKEGYQSSHREATEDEILAQPCVVEALRRVREDAEYDALCNARGMIGSIMVGVNRALNNVHQMDGDIAERQRALKG